MEFTADGVEDGVVGSEVEDGVIGIKDSFVGREDGDIGAALTGYGRGHIHAKVGG